MPDQPTSTTTRPKALWTTGVGTVIGVVVAGVMVSGSGTDLTLHFLIGAMFGWLVAIPAYRRAARGAQDRLATVALVSCIVAGGLMGLLLAAPLSLIFYLVIRRKQRVKSEE